MKGKQDGGTEKKKNNLTTHLTTRICTPYRLHYPSREAIRTSNTEESEIWHFVLHTSGQPSPLKLCFNCCFSLGYFVGVVLSEAMVNNWRAGVLTSVFLFALRPFVTYSVNTTSALPVLSYIYLYFDLPLLNLREEPN